MGQLEKDKKLFNNCLNEDELDFTEIITTINKNKFFIMSITLLLTTISIIYVLYKPNSYISKSILIPSDQSSKTVISGGAAAMAALAGINLGGGGSFDVASIFQNLLSDYAFNKPIIKKYQLDHMLDEKRIRKHLVFTLNQGIIYDFINNTFFTNKKLTTDELTFETFKKLKNILNVSKDKKSNDIILTAEYIDRFAIKKLVDIYLKEMSDYIKWLDLKEIDEQVRYYEEELQKAKNLDLKANINELLSNLVKKKVLSQAGEFYMVKQLTKPQVPYIEDKSGPKRFLIVLITFISSIVFAISIIFFKEFTQSNHEEKPSNNTNFIETNHYKHIYD